MYQISPIIIASLIIGYFLVLIFVSYVTSRKADNDTFFTANKSSPWYLVAFGMIGASLSGVTFISMPGVVGAGGYNQSFSYMQMVIGYLFGYGIIATVLMPLYYKLGLVTIYEYLRDRFGHYSYRTGTFYFILSRVIGASLRLFLVAVVLQNILMDGWGIPFPITVMITIGLIWVYTFSGGIKTIVMTDTLQTICMLGSVILSIYYIGQAMGLDIEGIYSTVRESELSKIWYTEVGWNDPNNMWKQLISGALIAVAMTGLDQDMMQKNLTCKNIGEAQKNMFAFSGVLILANLLFLTLGALLYIYASSEGIAIPDSTDQLYPTIAIQHMPAIVGVTFILGLIAAAYSSADSALTSLTTTVCVDFLDFKTDKKSENNKTAIRWKVHLGFSVLIWLVVVMAKWLNAGAVINELFKAAGYTYGPLLGLFSFGILTNRRINDKLVIPICILAPVICYLLVEYSDTLLGGFQFGSTIIALNGLLTFIGLWMISNSTKS